MNDFHTICSTLEADLDRLESDMAEAGRDEVAKWPVCHYVFCGCGRKKSASSDEHCARCISARVGT